MPIPVRLLTGGLLDDPFQIILDRLGLLLPLLWQVRNELPQLPGAGHRAEPRLRKRHHVETRKRVISAPESPPGSPHRIYPDRRTPMKNSLQHQGIPTTLPSQPLTVITSGGHTNYAVRFRNHELDGQSISAYRHRSRGSFVSPEWRTNEDDPSWDYSSISHMVFRCSCVDH